MTAEEIDAMQSVLVETVLTLRGFVNHPNRVARECLDTYERAMRGEMSPEAFNREMQSLLALHLVGDEAPA